MDTMTAPADVKSGKPGFSPEMKTGRARKTRSSERAQRDTLLWRKIRSGDDEALAQLFRNYNNMLYSYGIGLVSNEFLVKDCIQELFLTLWDRRSYLNDAYSVRSYLLSSLRRIIFRKLRQSKGIYERNRVYIDNNAPEGLTYEEEIIQSEKEREIRRRLNSALRHLGKRQKEAIDLKFYNGFSNSEIAEIMGINNQSVYNYVSGALQRLQKHV